MNIKEKIKTDLTSAMKAGDKKTAEALRGAIAAITNEEKKNGTTLTDADILKVLVKKVKDGKNSIEQFQIGKRQDLVEKEQGQIDIIEKYLPKSLTTEEINAAVKEIISAGNYGKADMGKVMKEFNSKYAGQADGKTVSELVRSLLS